MPDLPPGEGRIHRESRKSSRVWSPFRMLAPLTEIPAKWTIPHVARALMNGQFSDLKCHEILTDDYAYDNAVNFHEGPIRHAWSFARKLIEDPGGWWAGVDGHRIRICCHHFNTNSFIPDLDMRFNPFAEHQSQPKSTTPKPRGQRSSRIQAPPVAAASVAPPAALPVKRAAPETEAARALSKVPDATLRFMARSVDLSVGEIRSELSAWLRAHPACADWRSGLEQWLAGRAARPAGDVIVPVVFAGPAGAMNTWRARFRGAPAPVR